MSSINSDISSCDLCFSTAVQQAKIQLEHVSQSLQFHAKKCLTSWDSNDHAVIKNVGSITELKDKKLCDHHLMSLYSCFYINSCPMYNWNSLENSQQTCIAEFQRISQFLNIDNSMPSTAGQDGKWSCNDELYGNTFVHGHNTVSYTGHNIHWG